MKENYLQNLRQLFEYYQMLGDKTFVQLDEEQIFWQANSDSNSVAIIVKHLWGNMLSRWTDFLTSDGEKEWRDREAEFESDIADMAELKAKWAEGWACLFTALDSINEENMDSLIYIRNQGHTIIEAANRQLTHYAYHVGQIVFLAKLIKGEEWKSLSIPKGQSKAYNEAKFAEEKRKENFATEILKGSEDSSKTP